MLSTEQPRAPCCRQPVPFADAVTNLGRLGILLAGLADASQLVAAAGGEDRLHQSARTELFPEAPELLATLLAGGATVATWSGAGPSLLGICSEAAAEGRARAGSRGGDGSNSASTGRALASPRRWTASATPD